MKYFKLFTKLALGVSFVAFMSASCRKDDGDAIPHADVPFTLSLSESRQSGNFIWKIKDGGLSCEEQSMNELWVTYWNSCILSAHSEDPAFDGVNFRSSDPSLVRIDKIDESSCRLVYVSDSQEGASISITASTDNISHSFPVHSRSEIALEAVLVSINGKEYLLEEMGTDSGNKDTVIEPVLDDIRGYEGDLFTIVSLVPENASFRFVKRFTSSPITKTDRHETYGEWPSTEEGIRDVDWSEIEGRQAWFPAQAPHYFIKLRLETHSRATDGSKPSPKTWETYMRCRHTEPEE